MEFFQPLRRWIERYFQEREGPVELHFRFKYINTSSSKSVLDLLYLLELFRKKGKHSQVHWHYQANDVVMLETGKEFAEDIDLEFVMVPEEASI